MATITKNSWGTYTVRGTVGGVRRKRTFKDRASAIRFRDVMDLSPEISNTKFRLSDLFLAYCSQVSVKKKGYHFEKVRLEAFAKRPFAKKKVHDVRTGDIQNFVDDRLTEKAVRTGKPISPGTVRREIDLISSVFNWAKKKQLVAENPCKGLDLPKEPEHRERIASSEDIEKLLLASGWDGETPPTNDLQTAIAAFLFSCKTGMRSGEILALEEAWIENDRVIHLPAAITKTASKRSVALGSEAQRILNLVRKANGEDLFRMSAELRDALFRKVRDRAGLGPVCDSRGNVIKEGLHFHDGRATFATWAASPDPKTGAPRLDVMALARQTGHKDLKMLMRYYRKSAKELASRLDE